MWGAAIEAEGHNGAPTPPPWWGSRELSAVLNPQPSGWGHGAVLRWGAVGGPCSLRCYLQPGS